MKKWNIINESVLYCAFISNIFSDTAQARRFAMFSVNSAWFTHGATGWSLHGGIKPQVSALVFKHNFGLRNWST